MAGTDISKSLLQEMKITKISDYLQSKGWQIEDEIGDKAVVYANEAYEVILPLRKELRDYTKRILELLEVLEESEERPRQDILNDLLEPSQVSTLMGRDIVMFSLDFLSGNSNEAPISDLAKILESLQKTINLIALTKRIESNFPREQLEFQMERFHTKKSKTLEEDFGLTAFGTFKGSFGIKLAAPSKPVVEVDYVSEALKELFQLISLGDEIDELRENLIRLRYFTARKYTNFLKSIKNAKVNLTFDWGSYRLGYGGKTSISFIKAEETVKQISRIRDEEVVSFESIGVLTQASIKSRYFKFESENSGEEYKGYILPEAMPSNEDQDNEKNVVKLARCRVTLQKTIYTYYVTRKIEEEYLITKLDYI